jgi:hypothetical protein
MTRPRASRATIRAFSRRAFRLFFRAFRKHPFFFVLTLRESAGLAFFFENTLGFSFVFSRSGPAANVDFSCHFEKVPVWRFLPPRAGRER